MSGTSIPPTKPTFFELPTSAASAPTRKEPSSSLNLIAATFGDGGLGVRVFFGQLRHVVGEDEADADHEVHVLGGEQAQAGLAIRTLAGLDQPDVGTELLFGHDRAAV